MHKQCHLNGFGIDKNITKLIYKIPDKLKDKLKDKFIVSSDTENFT